jgi:hypothetical protein
MVIVARTATMRVLQAEKPTPSLSQWLGHPANVSFVPEFLRT